MVAEAGREDVEARFGDEVLLRYRYHDGHLQAALPMRAVDYSNDRLVAWLAPRTEIMYWALRDGRDPRVLSVSKRFTVPLTTAPTTWRGNGVLRVIPVSEPYQVIHFWADQGEFLGWYVNLEAPKARRGTRFDTVDWHLDLWINEAGRCEWKDVEEAQAAAAAGYLSQHELDLAWTTGQAIIDRGLADWLRRIGDWRSFSPPEAWGPVCLPTDWWR